MPMESKMSSADKGYTQTDIDKVWSQAWLDQSKSSESNLFNHHLFKAGYPVYKSYLPKQNVKLLEIGAGSGRYGLAIARDFPVSQVVLTDPVASSIEVIESAQNNLSLNNVVIELADATKLQYHDESFDVIFADGVIQHIIDIKTAMEELHRVLKPGGIMIISAVNSINPPHAAYKMSKKRHGEEYEYGYERTYKPSELRQLFLEFGLVDISIDGFSVAYGMVRLKRYRKIYGRLGTYLNSIIKMLDRLTNRWFTKRYGFMLFAVGTKPTTKLTNEKRNK